MNESEHAAFPWKASIFGSGDFLEHHVILDADCGLVATCVRGDPNAKAHAQLIAAVPKLLAACEAVLDTLDRNNVPVPSYLRRDEKQLRAAIAQATGEKSARAPAYFGA